MVADFETTIGLQSLPPKERKTEVWLSCYGMAEDYTDRTRFKTNYNIKDFFISLINDCTQLQYEYDVFVVFFHNLKFDGSFILNYLLKNNIHCETFINNMGVWYSITLDFGDFKIVFRDSLKILNFTIKEIGELFECETQKGETPLLETKPENILPEWEWYVRTDIEILAKAIYCMYHEEGFSKFTSASEALIRFKQTINYRKYYPVLSEDIDEYCRKSYRGGFSYVNRIYQGKIIKGDIVVYDINSMYPAVMLNNSLPTGIPTFYESDKKPESSCFIAKIHIICDIKKDHIPVIQVKDKRQASLIGAKTTEYITTTGGEQIELWVTNYDLELILAHYDCWITYESYYAFNTRKGAFDDYIYFYKNLKENAKTPAEKQKAKIMLNGLYGKFGSRIFTIQKIPSISENKLKLSNGPEEIVPPNYVPLASFITSIARYNIITEAQKHFNTFLYCDTDSLHLIDDGNITLPTDDNEFGKYALEGRFVSAKYLKAKLYVEKDKEGDLDVKGAGMTPDIKKQVTMENFEIGAVFEGKKKTMQVEGGMIIYDDVHTIRDNMFGR